MKKVWRQEWEESESGWGERPDGYSLHLTEKDVSEYIKDHWSKQPEHPPSTYSRPKGKPYQVEVTDEIYRQILNSKRFF